MKFTIPVERFDSIMQNDLMNVDIKLIKLDVQGFEYYKSEGMDCSLTKTIQAMKFEWAKKWLEAHGCGILPTIRNLWI